MNGLFKRLGIWSVVCCVSALPSFILAVQGGFNLVGIVYGVLVIILGFTFLNGAESVQRLLRRPHVRPALLIGIHSRVCFSLLVPIGWCIDLFPGIISVSIVELILDEDIMSMSSSSPPTFLASFLITLLQGVLLNIILAFYILIVFGFRCQTMPKRKPAGICVYCGYNLTGNVSGRCSECGTAIENEGQAG